MAQLVGEMPPECWMKRAFIDRLPSHVKGLLWLSTRMEILTLRELLERACAVLEDTKDEHLAAAAWPKQASPTPDLRETSQSGLNCFRCGAQIIWPEIVCSAVVLETGEKDQPCAVISATKQGILWKIVWRNGKWGDVSVTLFPIKLKEVLPVIEVVVNGKKHIALVDSERSLSLVIRSVCNPLS